MSSIGKHLLNAATVTGLIACGGITSLHISDSVRLSDCNTLPSCTSAVIEKDNAPAAGNAAFSAAMLAAGSHWAKKTLDL